MYIGSYQATLCLIKSPDVTAAAFISKKYEEKASFRRNCFKTAGNDEAKEARVAQSVER
jgi:hypothetical protein